MEPVDNPSVQEWTPRPFQLREYKTLLRQGMPIVAGSSHGDGEIQLGGKPCDS